MSSERALQLRKMVKKIYLPTVIDPLQEYTYIAVEFDGPESIREARVWKRELNLPDDYPKTDEEKEALILWMCESYDKHLTDTVEMAQYLASKMEAGPK